MVRVVWCGGVRPPSTVRTMGEEEASNMSHMWCVWWWYCEWSDVGGVMACVFMKERMWSFMFVVEGRGQ